MAKIPLLSVIIVNYNGAKYIKRCLDSVVESDMSGCEIIVVDDASTDGSRDILKNYTGGRIKLICQDQNIGAARARNAGVTKAKGEYLLFLDIDTEIDKDCLRTVAARLQEDKKIGAVQAKLVKGRTRKLETTGHFLSFAGFPYEITDESPLEKNLIFGGRSAALAVRRELFDKIGGCDEDYVIYGEDTDLSWRVWLAGYKVVFLPEAKVYHFTKSSLDIKTKYRIFYEGAKNNTANLLKNASLTTLLWMLPLHVAGWVIVSLKLIIQGRFDIAGWIYRGLWWNIKNLPRTSAKRKYVQSFTDLGNETRKIIFGPLGPKKLFIKGIQWIRQI